MQHIPWLSWQWHFQSPVTIDLVSDTDESVFLAQLEDLKIQLLMYWTLLLLSYLKTLMPTYVWKISGFLKIFLVFVQCSQAAA